MSHSDEPRPGEWATVIAQHCEGSRVKRGAVLLVDEVVPGHPLIFLYCTACGAQFAYDEPHALIKSREVWLPLRWLRRLPPPDEVQKFDEANRPTIIIKTRKIKVLLPYGEI